MTAQEYEKLTEEEAKKIFIKSWFETKQPLLKPPIILERAETITDPLQKLEWIEAQTTKFKAIKSGEYFEQFSGQNPTYKKLLYRPFGSVVLEQFTKQFTDLNNAINDYEYRTNPENTIQLDNAKERTKLEIYLIDLFNKAEQKQNRMEIGGRMDFLICAKHLKQWNKVCKYNPGHDKNPLNPELEIKKRIDELKQPQPLTPDTLKPPFRCEITAMEFTEIIKALIESKRIVEYQSETETIKYLAACLGLPKDIEKNHSGRLQRIKERNGKIFEGNKAYFISMLTDSLNTWIKNKDK